MKLRYKVIRGAWVSFDELFAEAANFATELGRDKVLSISHSEDKNDGVVTVWYWADA